MTGEVLDVVSIPDTAEEAQIDPDSQAVAPTTTPGAVTALISDIHGNLEALTVVLDDIAQRGIQRILCLGDIIGYGPNPCECLDLVIKKCQWSLMGNHEFAVLYEPTNFGASAESASLWTRRQIEQQPDADWRRKHWEFLGDLRIRVNSADSIFVHASPRQPINEYIFPDYVISSPQRMAQIFARIGRRCFVGHTHIAGVFTDEPDFYPPGDLHGIYHFSDREKCIVNPGSVGQPRDLDPRASYAILHPDRVEFVRLEYDIMAVVSKIKKIEDLNDSLGERLLRGSDPDLSQN